MKKPHLARLLAVFCLGSSGLCTPTTAEDATLHHFTRQSLTGTYFSEGANVGDFNRDGTPDVVYGPYWFAGPDYTARHEIDAPLPQDVNRYADNFFAWVHDVNGDGWDDVLVAGFPGTPAYVYENPQGKGLHTHWQKHQVFDWVSNESPQWVDLVGDSTPELVCTRDGFFGFATIDPAKPLGTWTFHAVSTQVAPKRFGHGLGIGDVNGDGRHDILHAEGWYEQPAADAEDSRWRHHPAKLADGYGGAEMYAYDVDGDGDNDIITSDAAHDFGLAWYEQTQDDGRIEFVRHPIMGSHPAENKYGVLFSELHSVALADIDGDGLKDIVTGKTYWSHHRKSPMWDAGAVVYWFKLVRDESGVDWVPHRIDADAGIGRQITVSDINGDALPDIIVGGMKGASVLTHHTESVSQQQWLAAQPKPYSGPPVPSVEGTTSKRGPKSVIVASTGKVVDALEGEAMTGQVTAGTARVQDMSGFGSDRWSGNAQLFWTGGRPGDQWTLELPECQGPVDVEIVLTCAKDYGIVQLSLDSFPLGKPIDLYETNVVTTGVLAFSDLDVTGGKHKLTLQIVGANSKAQPAYFVAIDYIRIRPAR